MKLILITSSGDSMHVVNREANQFEKVCQLQESLDGNDMYI
jgi:hypothetical protein